MLCASISSNNEERSDQVKVMGKIYARADLVLAWLGELDDSVDLAFRGVQPCLWAIKLLITDHFARTRGILISDVSWEIAKAVLEERLSYTPELWVVHLEDIKLHLPFDEASSGLFLEHCVPGLNLSELAKLRWARDSFTE